MRVLYKPTGLIVCAERSRSQQDNRATAWAELEARLQANLEVAQAARLNAARREQIETAERPMRNFTWTAWRDEVRNHETGQRWRMSDLLKGKIKG